MGRARSLILLVAVAGGLLAAPVAGHAALGMKTTLRVGTASTSTKSWG